MNILKIIFLLSMMGSISCQSKPKELSTGHSDHPRGKVLYHLTLAEIEKYVKSEKEHLFTLQGDLVERSLREKNWAAVDKYSKEYLKMAEEYKSDWNYGNAIYDANIALGLVALQNKNSKLAIEHLLSASKTPGSPQLDSFGPFNGAHDWDLTQELYKMGERKSLITYAENCLKFVTKKHSYKTDEDKKIGQDVTTSNREKIERFISQVKSNAVPTRL